MCYSNFIASQLLVKEGRVKSYNFPPRQIAYLISEVLVLGVVLDDREVVLIQPDKGCSGGQKNFIARYGIFG